MDRRAYALSNTIEDDDELQASMLPRFQRKALEDQIAAFPSPEKLPLDASEYHPGLQELEDGTAAFFNTRHCQNCGATTHRTTRCPAQRLSVPLPLGQPYVGCRGPGTISTHTLLTMTGELPLPPPPVQEPAGVPQYKPFKGPVHPPKAPRAMLEMRHTGQRPRDRETGLPISSPASFSQSAPITPTVSQQTFDALRGNYRLPGSGNHRSREDYVNGVAYRMDELQQQVQDCHTHYNTLYPIYEQVLARIHELENDPELIAQPIKQQAIEGKVDQVLAAVKAQATYVEANPTPAQADQAQATYAKATQILPSARDIPAFIPRSQAALDPAQNFPALAANSQAPSITNKNISSAAGPAAVSTSRISGPPLNDIDSQNREVWMRRRPKKASPFWYEYCRISPACFACGDPNHTANDCGVPTTAAMRKGFKDAVDRAARRIQVPNLQVYAVGVKKIIAIRPPPAATAGSRPATVKTPFATSSTGTSTTGASTTGAQPSNTTIQNAKTMVTKSAGQSGVGSALGATLESGFRANSPVFDSRKGIHVPAISVARTASGSANSDLLIDLNY